ncbi:MAG TPA: DUF368 domain-containing protein [Methanoregulaceae archaeon]|nr:DUF368 domain-containing protein [Methanoregulaceae archaeon]
MIPKSDAREGITIFLKGILMGACDIIPGVSGGTIALITGIYERLISAIGNIGVSPFLHLLRGEKDEWEKGITLMDPGFLVVLLAGIGLAALIMSRIILFFLDFYAAETFAFFFGIVFASSALIYLKIEKADHIIAGMWVFFGLVLGYSIAGMDQASLGHSLPIIFFTGMVALCAMILPGISGAYITLLLNQYEYLLEALRSFDLAPVITFLLGGVMGLLAFSRVLRYLLRNFHTQTLGFLTGLMLGSTRLLYDMITIAGGTFFSVWPLVIIGVVLVVGMEFIWRRYTALSKKKGIE